MQSYTPIKKDFLLINLETMLGYSISIPDAKKTFKNKKEIKKESN